MRTVLFGLLLAVASVNGLAMQEQRAKLQLRGDADTTTLIQQSIAELEAKVVNMVNELKSQLATVKENNDKNIQQMQLNLDNKFGDMKKEMDITQNNNVETQKAITEQQGKQIADLVKETTDQKASLSSMKNKVSLIPTLAAPNAKPKMMKSSIEDAVKSAVAKVGDVGDGVVKAKQEGSGDFSFGR
eukprot:CAMPEP_0175152290 /NCGR_PEP_ID=MMETSP0087-20121206/19021_1 /TAXON_ID=136419 /ORGANISM="Unknown Unknown, Strain D1" /LENGTH=186 /DNA_ID=CAMNT_0016438685 /DNA_START=14 /DNA_END=574 /DNA_ORIENTATION=+